MNAFFEARKHLPYYVRVRKILKELVVESHLDVGCWDTPVCKWSNAHQRFAINLEHIEPRYRLKGVSYTFGDFLRKNMGQFDLITCLQVIEHQKDDTVKHFTQKLFDHGKIVIISIPWEWREDQCKYHPQDPIGYDKLKEWTERDPDALYIDQTRRAVAVYGTNV